MKRYRNLLKFSLAVVGLLLAGSAAKADTLTFTLDQAFQSGPSDLFVFTGTIAYTNTDSLNDGGLTEYLNADSFSVDVPATLDDSSFLLNAPLFMNPGDSFSGVIFTVTTPPYMDGLPNFYTGSFSIVGGNSSLDDTDVLATENFDIQVTPEPPSWELLAMALLGLLGVIGWKSYCRQALAA
ncbi:MAG: hypothetical protein ABSD59_24230 [Terracidiphilus sp.]